MTEPRAVDPTFHLPTRRVLALLVFLVAVFWLARPVLMPFVVAAIIAYAFGPYIDTVQARTGRSRLLIVILLYGTGLVVVGALVLAFAGPVYSELDLLVRAGPDALVTALRQLIGSDTLTLGDRAVTAQELALQLQAAVNAFLQTPEGALRAAEQILHASIDVILTVIVTFYLLLDGRRFGETALRFLDPADREQMARVTSRIHVVVGRWLRGQLVLVVLVSVVATIGLGLLHLPHAVALGVLTGVLEVITFIGPIVAGTVVAIVALSSGGLPLAIAAVLFLFILRQVEDVFVMPNVLGRAVHLHPLAALFAVVVGTTAFGILGTFLAVPVAAAINVALHEFFPAELGRLPGDPAPEAEASTAAEEEDAGSGDSDGRASLDTTRA